MKGKTADSRSRQFSNFGDRGASVVPLVLVPAEDLPRRHDAGRLGRRALGVVDALSGQHVFEFLVGQLADRHAVVCLLAQATIDGTIADVAAGLDPTEHPPVNMCEVVAFAITQLAFPIAAE